MPADDSLTPKQQTFITAYLTPGLTIEAAAKLAGIGEKTAYRWLKLPYVQVGIKKARADIYELSIAGLVHLIEKSVETLDRNMNGEEVPPSTQVRAAQIVIEQSTAIYKMSELEREIDELKQALGLKELED